MIGSSDRVNVRIHDPVISRQAVAFQFHIGDLRIDRRAQTEVGLEAEDPIDQGIVKCGVVRGVLDTSVAPGFRGIPRMAGNLAADPAEFPTALASWCARTDGRRPFSEGATAPVCSWLHTNWRAPPRLLLRRTEFIPFFPFRWFRLSEPIDRWGRNGMNSVLRLPGYGSWGRARTGPWLRTNRRAPTPFPRETPKNKEFGLTSTFQMIILLWMDCPGPCPVLTGVLLFYGPPHLLF